MTDYDRLVSFFEGREWYDYSTLSFNDHCHRKMFYSRVGVHGRLLENIVGPAANIGTCIHAGIAAYTAGWGVLTDEQRRFMAVRSFASHYSQYDFTITKGRRSGLIPTAHTLARGVEILDGYFSQYSQEDPVLRPIEAELGFAVEITPRIGEPDFLPFTYIGSIDGIFERSYDRALLPRETKTTSGNAEGRLSQLNFNHQPVGYVSCLREFPETKDVYLFIGDVVLIAAQKLEYARNYFETNERQRQSWRTQVINKVEEHRARLAAARDRSLQEQLDIFYQNTEDCFSYGKCPYYDVCDYNAAADTVTEFESGRWNPLLRNVPQKTLISAEGQIDSITVER